MLNRFDEGAEGLADVYDQLEEVVLNGGNESINSKREEKIELLRAQIQEKTLFLS